MASFPFPRASSTLTALLISALPLAAEWEVLPGIGQGSIHQVSFVDQNRAWMAVGDGLLRTSNQGRSWHTVSLPDALELSHLAGVEVKQRKDGTLFGWAFSSTGHILHTTDGERWTTQHRLPAELKNQISCLSVLDDQHAWVSGAGFTWRTTDGGQNWMQVSPADPKKLQGDRFKDDHLNALIHFRDPKNGIAIATGGYSGVLLKETKDGGKTWITQPNPKNRKGSSTFQVFRSPSAFHIHSGGHEIYTQGELATERAFMNSLLERTTVPDGTKIVANENQHFWILSKDIVAAHERVNTYHSALHLSQNRGAEWHRSYLSAALQSIHFFDEKNGWAAGSAGRVGRTTDGGLTWEHRFLSSQTHFRHVVFHHRKIGWAAGAPTTKAARPLWKTTDGGSTWKPLPAIEPGRPGPHDILESIGGLLFLDAKRGWAITHGATPKPVNGYTSYARILTTRDGGESWQEVYQGDGEAFRDLKHRNGRFWIAGSGVFTSSDGQRWERTKARGTLFGIAQPRPDLTLAVGESGSLIFTRNDGTQWEDRPLGFLHRTHLDGIHFADEETGWIIGSSSIDGLHEGLFASRDGGRLWNVVDLTWPKNFAKHERHYLRWFDLSAPSSKHAWLLGGSNSRSLLLRRR